MVLKACVIGLGILGKEYVTRLDSRPEVDVVGVADILEERAREVGMSVHATVYTDYVPMLREQRPDIAVIATPDSLHRDPVMAAIEIGVPAIIQEKPMATTVADAEAMLDAAEKAGARIFVNYANRGSPLDRATHYVIQQGLLGRIVYGESHLDDHIAVPTRLWGSRTRSWAEGSSTAHFLLSHSVDFLRWVMAPAEITEVFAISQRKVLVYTPDLYDAFLTFDNGAKFRVKAEWIKHMDELVEFSLDFSGAEGSLRYNKIAGFAESAGWRANLSAKLDCGEMLRHQGAHPSRRPAGRCGGEGGGRAPVQSGGLQCASGRVAPGGQLRGCHLGGDAHAVLVGPLRPVAQRHRRPAPDTGRGRDCEVGGAGTGY